MDFSFEPLSERHRVEVVDILNYYIANSTSAYRDSTVGYEHYDSFLNSDDIHSGYAVVGTDREVVGFCTLEPFSSLPPFRRTAEVLYFLKDGYTGKGLGKTMLGKLEADAKIHQVTRLVAEIADDNESSIAFHRRNGFAEYGRLARCWTKFNRTLGIVYMEKDVIQPRTNVRIDSI